MYPKWMRVLLVFFDCWGFSTQFFRSSNHQNIYRLIFFMHMIMASISTLVMTQFFTRPTFLLDRLGAINETLKLISILLVYWISTIELFFKQKTQKRFWNIVENIDKQFCCHQNIYFKSLILKLIIYNIFGLLLFINYLVRIIIKQRNDVQSFWIVFWLCYSFIGILRENQIFYYLFSVEYIKTELSVINREVSEMCKNGSLLSVKFFVKTFHHNRVKWFRKFYASIYDLYEVINTVFGWSNCAAILISFHLMLADFNWNYWKIFNKFKVDKIGNHFIFFYFSFTSCHNNIAFQIQNRIQFDGCSYDSSVFRVPCNVQVLFIGEK